LGFVEVAAECSREEEALLQDDFDLLHSMGVEEQVLLVALVPGN
jgi:hypothetical protein